MCIIFKWEKARFSRSQSHTGFGILAMRNSYCFLGKTSREFAALYDNTFYQHSGRGQILLDCLMHISQYNRGEFDVLDVPRAMACISCNLLIGRTLGCKKIRSRFSREVNGILGKDQVFSVCFSRCSTLKPGRRCGQTY